jgi:hypothetical protein
MHTPALIAMLLALPAAAHAADKLTKQARPGDVASEYSLTESGDLYRQVGKRRCQITTRVTELKVATHPADGAAVYFVKDGDLMALVPPPRPGGACPKADVRHVASGVKKFTLVSDAASPFVLMALDRDDRFRAIGPEGAIDVPDATAFSMNACHGQQGRRFSSYAAFVIDRFGMVTKVKGSEAAEKTDFKRAYASLDEFRNVNQVCAAQ